MQNGHGLVDESWVGKLGTGFGQEGRLIRARRLHLVEDALEPHASWPCIMVSDRKAVPHGLGLDGSAPWPWTGWQCIMALNWMAVHHGLGPDDHQAG